MNVQLSVVGEVVVDDQRHLLHVNASRPHISGDEDTTEEEQQQNTHMKQNVQENGRGKKRTKYICTIVMYSTIQAI